MMVIIESESMSRSSANVDSAFTDSTGRPVSSLTISARPSRISVALSAMVLSSHGVCLVGEDDHLRGVRHSGAEADLQGDLSSGGLVLTEQALRCQGN